MEQSLVARDEVARIPLSRIHRVAEVKAQSTAKLSQNHRFGADSFALA